MVQEDIKLSTLEVILKGFRVIEHRDRIKAVYVVIINCILGIADIFGVILIGLMGSIAVGGFSSKKPGNRTQSLLDLIGLGSERLSVQVTVLGLFGSFILLVKSFMSLYLSRRVMFFLSRRSAVISQKLIANLFNQDISKLRERTILESVYALTTGVQSVTANILGAVLILLSDVFLILAFSVSLFIVDTLVAISSLVLFSLVGLFLYLFMHKRAQSLGEKATNLEISGSEKIMEVVMCYRELLVRNRRSYYAKEIGQMRFSIAEAAARVRLMSLLSKYVMEITLVLGGLIVGAVQFLTQPPIRATAVVAIFLVSSTRIGPAVLRVQTGFMTIKNNIGIAGPTLKLIDEYLVGENVKVQEIPENSNDELSTEYQNFIPKVTMKNVDFTYPHAKKTTVSSVDLIIEPGEFVGIAGPSGSGKSTIVDLMLGILNPSGGLIQLGGMSPTDIYLKWPGAVAYVPQNTNLINGSLKKNICLGFDPDSIADEIVEELLKSVKLDEFLLAPDGIHTSVGEQGNRLSGGQKQRLGLARALLTRPKLLILDEATSSLDAETENQISEFLLSKKGELTMVVVAHRLSTIMQADRIVYFSNGEVRGVGTFNDLRSEVQEFNLQANAMGL
jgi:ABC-type multidrug transport system fused ATPase/permease subunit